MVIVMRPIMRYHGGKWGLAPWIIGHFPPHRVYVEPYGGAASVLMRKPRSYCEVWNDLDQEVFNVFQVVRDKKSARELERRLRLTPYSRAELNASYQGSDDQIERARRTVVRSFMGFASAAVNSGHQTGFRSKSHQSGTSAPHDWANYHDFIETFTLRLMDVVLECRPALEVMVQHDRPDTLFYLDPPYVPATRYNGTLTSCYTHEMNEKDHREMAETVKSLCGMVVLSGYNCPLYEELFSEWQRIDRDTFVCAAKPRTESLWINHAAGRVPGLPLGGAA